MAQYYGQGNFARVGRQVLNESPQYGNLNGGGGGIDYPPRNIASYPNPVPFSDMNYPMNNQYGRPLPDEFNQMLRQEKKPYKERGNSRQKESDALLMLDEYQKATSGKSNTLAKIFSANGLQDPAELMNGGGGGNGSMGYMNNGVGNGGYGDAIGYYNNNFMTTSPPMQGPNIGYNPPGMIHAYSEPNFRPYDPYEDPQYLAWQQEKSKEKLRKEKEKVSEMLMASLERQNTILARLAGNIAKDRDEKATLETYEIEQKIKKLELETQMKEHQKFKHEQLGLLATNYNRPIPDRMYQGYNPFLNPALGMHSNPYGQIRPSPANMLMDPAFNPQMKKLMQKEKEKEKARKRKEEKLEKLLLLLALDEKDKGDEKPPVKSGDDLQAQDEEKRRQARAVEEALEKERQRLAEEKRKEDEVLQRKRRKLLHRAVLWLMVYPLLWEKQFEKNRKLKREQYEAKMSESFGPNLEFAKSWSLKAADRALNKLDLKTNMVIVPLDNKKIADKDMTARIQAVFDICKLVLEGMTTASTEDLMQKQFLEFLASFMFDHCFVPQSFLFDFEINRLNFNSYGQLKGTTQMKVKLMLCFFLLIKTMIHRIMLRPWEYRPNLKLPVKENEKTQFKTGIKTIGSVLFIIALEYVKTLTPLQPDNQKHLTIENKIKPMPAALKVFDDYAPTEEELKRKKDEGDLIIQGLYKKEQLAEIMAKKPLMDQLKALVTGWADKVYEILERINKEKAKNTKAKKQKAERIVLILIICVIWIYFEKVKVVTVEYANCKVNCCLLSMLCDLAIE